MKRTLLFTALTLAMAACSSPVPTGTDGTVRPSLSCSGASSNCGGGSGGGGGGGGTGNNSNNPPHTAGHH